MYLYGIVEDDGAGIIRHIYIIAAADIRLGVDVTHVETAGIVDIDPEIAHSQLVTVMNTQVFGSFIHSLLYFFAQGLQLSRRLEEVLALPAPMIGELPAGMFHGLA